MNARPIHLHIEEIVLHGFPAGERHGIADAIQRELAAALAEQPSPLSPRAPVSVAAVDAGAFSARDRSPSQLGRQIARSVGGAVAGAMNAPANAKGAAP